MWSVNSWKKKCRIWAHSKDILDSIENGIIVALFVICLIYLKMKFVC